MKRSPEKRITRSMVKKHGQNVIFVASPFKDFFPLGLHLLPALPLQFQLSVLISRLRVDLIEKGTEEMHSNILECCDLMENMQKRDLCGRGRTKRNELIGVKTYL
jgi:hypothetical protein